METQLISDRGFWNGSLPGPTINLMHQALQGWKILCNKDADFKQQLHYPDKGNKDGFGYQAGNDPKELIELTPKAISTLLNGAVKDWDFGTRDFLNESAKLLHALEQPILNFAQGIESAYNMPDFADEVLESKHHWMLRFIHYLQGGEIGTEIGGAHADKSGFTLKLYENCKGLEYLTQKKTWEELPVSDSNTIIIPNLQLQLRSEGKLEALWHRVVSTPESVQNGRYSLVVFINLTKTPAFDRKRQGYIQTKEPGFNYGMKHGTFKGFFAEYE